MPYQTKLPKIYLIPTKTFASFHIECDSIQKERSPFDALEHVLFMVWLNWSFFGTLSQKCICKKDSFVWMLFLYLVTASHWTEGSLEMSLKQILFECSAGAEILKNCKQNCKWNSLLKRRRANVRAEIFWLTINEIAKFKWIVLSQPFI